MEKTIGEDEFKGLEEEIDLAVDRLFVEKKREGQEPFTSNPPHREAPRDPWSLLVSESPREPLPLEPPAEEPSFELSPVPPFEFSLEPSPQPSPEPFPEPFQELTPEPAPETPPEPTFDLSFEMERPVEFDREVPPPSDPFPVLKPLETMETQLLSLEWEITGENIEKTLKEIRSLRGELQENGEALAVLDYMEKVLAHMIEHGENIRPPLISFLMDAKETLKLLLKKDSDRETRTYRNLAVAGLEARFSGLEEFREPVRVSPPAPVIEKTPGEDVLQGMEKWANEILTQMNRFSERVDDQLTRIHQRLSALEEAPPKPSPPSRERNLQPVDVTVFKIGEQLFGVESDKVFKLFKIPDAFHQKVTDQSRIRLKDLDVRMIDLRKYFSMEGERPTGDIRILALKDDEEFKGVMVDQVVKKVTALSETGEDHGDYISGKIRWRYQGQFVEIPVLDVTKF